MEWYIKCIKNYFNFNGRARRKELWMFVLFNFLTAILVSVLDRVLGTGIQSGNNYLGLISSLYSLFILLPSLAVGVRRLHDIWKSGAWILITLIPLVGFIWLIVLYATEGNRNTNQYGPDPKEIVNNDSYITE